jgi:hypothetical protein
MDVKRTLDVNSIKSAVIYYIKTSASYEKCLGRLLDEELLLNLKSFSVWIKGWNMQCQGIFSYIKIKTRRLI